MAKFYGKIGYGETIETAPGVWVDSITEYMYYGDIIRNTRRLVDGEKLNNDLTVGNSISIVADAYAREHFFSMRYIQWAGTLWTISDVEVKSPRLVLRLGGVYNGPIAAPPAGAPGDDSGDD